MTEFAYYLARYLGGEAPGQMTSTKTNYIKVLFCPGYGQFSMEEPALAQTRVTYILTFPYTNDTVQLSIKPFGAATTSTGPSQKASWTSARESRFSTANSTGDAESGCS